MCVCVHLKIVRRVIHLGKEEEIQRKGNERDKIKRGTQDSVLTDVDYVCVYVCVCVCNIYIYTV